MTAIPTVPEFSMDAILSTLNNDQLDHLSLGLEHTFGVVLAGNHGEPETFNLVLENGKLVALHSTTITVQDVWDTAERLS